MHLIKYVVIMTLLCPGAMLVAQETVFNVPSGDILTKGKVYAEFDDAAYFAQQSTEFEPRIVFGIGHNVEAGLNLPYVTEPGSTTTTAISPTLKWRFYDGGSNGWAAYTGINLFVPVHIRTYDLGDYIYSEISKTMKGGTRLAAGPYDFTHGVVSRGNRAGIQASIEQPVTKSVKLAADWLSGTSSVGYIAPGLIYSAKRLSLYGAYEIGNSGVTRGNHGLLLEVGWNLN